MPIPDSYTRRGQINPWDRPFYGDAGGDIVGELSTVYMGQTPDGRQHAWLRTGCELGLANTMDMSQAVWVPTTFIPDLSGATSMDKLWMAANVRQRSNCPVSPGVVVIPDPVATVDVAQHMPPIVTDDQHHLDITVVIPNTNNLQSEVALSVGDTPTEAAQKVEQRLAQWVQGGQLDEAGRSGTNVSARPATSILLLYDI